MKLAVVTDTWDPEGGGRERYVAAFVRQLPAEVDLRVYCRRSWRPETHPATLTVFRGPSVLAEPALQQAVRRFRRRHPGATVLALRPVGGATHYQLHSGLHRRAFEAERESFGPGLRSALYWPAVRLNLRRSRVLRLERRLLRRPGGARLMAFSDAAGDEAAAATGIPRAEIAVAPLGVDRSVFHPGAGGRSAGREEGLRLLFVGHNFTLKGLGPLLHVVAAAAARGLHLQLAVVGSGGRAPFEAMCGRLGIAPRVRFLGRLRERAVAEMYRSSDLLVHPAFYDPSPHAVIEALACGCPVLTTSRCGFAPVVRQAGGPVVDHPSAVEAMVGAVAEIAATPRLEALRHAAAAVGRGFDQSAHFERVMQWLSPHGGASA